MFFKGNRAEEFPAVASDSPQAAGTITHQPKVKQPVRLESSL